MSKFKIECLIVSVFVLLVMLAKVGVPFTSIATMPVLLNVIGFLFYLGITSTDFKTEPFQVFFAIYYKMFFVTALFFTLKDYPGKDIMSAVALISAILYIIFVIVKNKKNDLYFIAIIYITLFCSFLTIVR
ncbi:MAG: hypothetical protein PHE33_08700 [Bacteroidales bacterium]|nr:hypothetical protein [Bacteroidales bacterium]